VHNDTQLNDTQHNDAQHNITTLLLQYCKILFFFRLLLLSSLSEDVEVNPGLETSIDPAPGKGIIFLHCAIG
jgi:hypothetical protein